MKITIIFLDGIPQLNDRDIILVQNEIDLVHKILRLTLHAQ